MPLLISNGSSLESPQTIESVTNANSREEQVMRLGGGFSPAAETGSITTATSTVGGSTDYGYVGNMTVSITTGTAVGVNATFEASMDAGTTWFPISGQREDTGIPEASTGVLPASTTPRTWMFPMAAANRFRVRATAWTSGTAAVRIQAGPTLVDPVVAAVPSNPLGSQLVSYTAANAAYTITTEALRSLVGMRNLAAATTATTQTVPTGKTFRILNFNVIVRQGAVTSALAVTFNLRAVLTGTATATSPVVTNTAAAVTNVVGASATGGGVLSPFIELPGGSSWGVSDLSSATSAGTTVWVVVNGIEF